MLEGKRDLRTMVSKRGRKSSFTQEISDRLVEAVKELGDIKQAAEVCGIKYATVMLWRRSHLDFKDALEAALLYFKRNQYSEIRRKCQEEMLRIVYEGVREVKTVEQTTKNPEGAVTFITTTVTTVEKGPPLRVLERYLGPPMDVLDAVQLLGSHQLLSEDDVERIYLALQQAEQSSRDILQRKLKDGNPNEKPPTTDDAGGQEETED